jgi:hypothetical protein
MLGGAEDFDGGTIVLKSSLERVDDARGGREATVPSRVAR